MSSGPPHYADRFRISENTASHFGIKPVVMPVVGAAEIEHAIAAFAREPDGGLLLSADVGITVHCDLIIAVAARYRLPAIYLFRVMATSGGLMSYGADVILLRGRRPMLVAFSRAKSPAGFRFSWRPKSARSPTRLGLIHPTLLRGTSRTCLRSCGRMHVALPLSSGCWRSSASVACHRRVSGLEEG